jgi:hypothetical protein
MAFERLAAQNNPSRFPNSFFRGNFSFELISDRLTVDFLLRLISGFMRPVRTKKHRSIQRKKLYL